MPAKTAQSALLAKLGDRLKTAHEQHKDDQTEFSSFGNLPPGIENGVAKLVDCKFTQIKEGKQNAGEWMFYAAGIVVSPKVAGPKGDVLVEGLRTQISEPLFDTPTRTRQTLNDHVAWVYNELRKLGVETSGITHDQLESVAAALKEAGPHFRFRTWAGSKQEVVKTLAGWEVHQDGKRTAGPYATEADLRVKQPYAGKEPMVNHQWNGVCDWVETDAAGGVDDNTGEAPAAAPSANGVAHPPGEYRDDMDVESLVAAAAGKGKVASEAQAQLEAMALKAGVAQEDIDGADDWAAVAELIKGGGSGDDGGDDGEVTPEKGNVFFFAPPDPKNAKKRLKSVECKVTAVNAGKRTADLQALSDKNKKFAGVSWDDLETPPE